VTMVERKTGYTVMGKLSRHTATECTEKWIELVSRHVGFRTPEECWGQASWT